MTFLPDAAIATARLAAVVDFPSCATALVTRSIWACGSRFAKSRLTRSFL